MAGEIIRKGDPTSHNGVVLEGSLFDICMGQPIAYIGHKVYCPKCKGVFPIVEGVVTTTFYGKGVALAGMKTSCGAVLIATQLTDTVEWSSGTEGAGATARAAVEAVASAGLVSAASTNASASTSPAVQEQFDEQFVLLDDEGGVLAGMPYTLKLCSGAFEQGVTDDKGLTHRCMTDGAQPIEVYLGHHQA